MLIIFLNYSLKFNKLQFKIIINKNSIQLIILRFLLVLDLF
jgi:hypothetical protein